MPSRDEVMYFGAGPAPLPTSVLEKGAKAFVNFEYTGLSLAEISHRSKTAEKILADTKSALIKLLDIPDNYDVLFMHGGGSGEFSAVVFNMVAHWVERRRHQAMTDLNGDANKVLERVKKEVREDLVSEYLVSGSWSLKASQEAANLLAPLGGSPVKIAVDARQDKRFGRIPPEDTWTLSAKETAFTYLCDNETVDGVEFPAMPQCLKRNKYVVADMSSNFLSRPVKVSDYAVIFGGAQKNIGITDITLCIIRNDITDNMPDPSFLHAVGVWSPPVVFNWKTIRANNSLYNTLPIFSIWIAGQVVKSLLDTYGDEKLLGQEKVSNRKAQLIYDALDARPDVYKVVCEKDCRSRMNICFRVAKGEEKQEARFLQGAEKLNLLGLKGHRSVGGVRASMYNAVQIEKALAVVKYLEEFSIE